MLAVEFVYDMVSGNCKTNCVQYVPCSRVYHELKITKHLTYTSGTGTDAG